MASVIESALKIDSVLVWEISSGLELRDGGVLDRLLWKLSGKINWSVGSCRRGSIANAFDGEDEAMDFIGLDPCFLSCSLSKGSSEKPAGIFL